MKKFVFGLETLLRHRINIEERERNKFTRIRAELQEEQINGQALGDRQTQTLNELAQQKSGACEGREIEWYYRFLHRLEQELKRSAERAAELGKRLEAQKQAMIEAARNKQMIENLKKKKRKEYVISLEREEQKSIDEMVVTRFPLRQ